MEQRIALIGGGNMAQAIIGGLLRQGTPADVIEVLEPFAPTRDTLHTTYGVTTHAAAGDFLQNAALVIWAVKPQIFKEAAAPVKALVQNALHVSVAAGIRSDSLADWLGSERIVRCMPNTPALIGKGISGLYARPDVSAEDRDWTVRIMSGTGECIWLEHENQLDAVTALSGSGPAYVFYFLEAMTTAGVQMGLDETQAYRLAVSTFTGASALAQASSEPASVLRERVTSKGGTTFSAITSLEQSQVKNAFVSAILAAEQRAKELGDSLR
jgi:pyrroline-5-carboxylate reductase